MTNREIYKIWAPANKKWVDWVRPVPFIEIGKKDEPYMPSCIELPFLENFNCENTAIIVDLHGLRSVEAGIILAKHGYRPIPIYNGVTEQKDARATTDNTSIDSALDWGASILNEMTIPDDALPAFLTDANRLQQYRLDNTVFDNSWDVYPQDLPSEDYLLKNGITKILIIGHSFAKDLKAIFKEYPKKKISIYLTDGYDEPKCIKRGKK